MAAMDDQHHEQPVAVVVVHAPSDKSIKKFTLYDHPNSSTDSAASTSAASSTGGTNTAASTSQQARDLERRRHALQELVDSEKAYVADLHTLLDIYIGRLPTLLPSLDVSLVARNSSDLLAFHQTFATSLSLAGRRKPTEEAIRAVAQAFLDAVRPESCVTFTRLTNRPLGLWILDLRHVLPRPPRCHRGHPANRVARRVCDIRAHVRCTGLTRPTPPPARGHGSSSNAGPLQINSREEG